MHGRLLFMFAGKAWGTTITLGGTWRRILLFCIRGSCRQGRITEPLIPRITSCSGFESSGALDSLCRSLDRCCISSPPARRVCCCRLTCAFGSTCFAGGGQVKSRCGTRLNLTKQRVCSLATACGVWNQKTVAAMCVRNPFAAMYALLPHPVSIL